MSRTCAVRPSTAAAHERRSKRRTSISTPLTRAFARAASTLSLLVVEAKHRLEAKPGRGDREHSGAGAHVQQRPRRGLQGGELEQQLQAQTRAGVGAGAERLPWVDHDLAHRRWTRRARLLPWRAHVQRRDRRSRPSPAVVAPRSAPAGGTASSARASRRGSRWWRSPRAHRPRARFTSGSRRQLAGRTVDGVLDRPRLALHLLDSGRRELQQLRQHELCLLAGDADGEPDHAAWLPSARRSLLNTDS